MKKAIYAVTLVLIGALVGGGIAYTQVKSISKSASRSQRDQSQANSCEVDVADSDLKKKLKEKTDLTEAEIESASSYLKFKRIKESIIPSGAPGYGSQLEVSYNQADQAVEVLASLEQKIGKESLTSKEKERYVEIGTTEGTACEFCCGLDEGFARSNGQRACGCAHNRAFSGLTMWMIQNGYSNQEILSEVSNWKSSFFPKQTLTQRLQQMKKDNPEVEKILEEFPAFLPQMVGGC